MAIVSEKRGRIAGKNKRRRGRRGSRPIDGKEREGMPPLNCR